MDNTPNTSFKNYIYSKIFGWHQTTCSGRVLPIKLVINSLSICFSHKQILKTDNKRLKYINNSSYNTPIIHSAVEGNTIEVPLDEIMGPQIM